MSLLRVLARFIAVCAFSALQLQAQQATCTNWNLWLLNPANANNPREEARAVNDNRTVVGFASSLSSKSTWGFVHYSSGKVTYWKPENAKVSTLTGRNNWGNTVGYYTDTLGINHAAYLHGSTTTLIVHPKAAHHSTGLTGINNLNTLLGSYTDSNGKNHIFKRRSNGTFLSVPNFPGAKATAATGFNDNGVVVGWYILPTETNVSHGFIYRNGSFATVNYRNFQTLTYLQGIDKNGVIVGNSYASGFLYKNGVFKKIVGPHGEDPTVYGISANGVITGNIWISGTGQHGFTANCQ
jgi:hypothetical protein